MATIDMESVKTLRERTGAGVLDCKKALVASDGNIDKAIDVLREKGLAKAISKSSREAGDGMVFTYIHAGGKLGVLVELNCETDFVAKTEDFQGLGKEIAIQVAATDPSFIRPEDVPADVVDHEKALYRVQLEAEKKPEQVWEKIIEGKLGAYYKENCLIQQPYIRDESKTIDELIKAMIAKTGENIVVARFVRFKIGGKPTVC
ncbi:translation elongation factor Ts [Candidatus Cryosericum hinesii]|jgi:elongation factor Ts|uniref:Elongation factor Ts n=1 Tax=Candidatus Cryosericum hinesii TaxID=2290915 RepID=A0A398DSW9_9BACT|nr:translation elongation factor Ts [Candidatus Cryosericum hinesii]RIE11250.1 translation elongation factor Ts [Candidatus Cryosericum hinesii]RIE15208.1 translation elongation factor Ts [Candidatus Cryosericum hinesii]RIE15738.1 translation elongation factor Ts [Candidatus Cryosericum hinesii]